MTYLPSTYPSLCGKRFCPGAHWGDHMLRCPGPFPASHHPACTPTFTLHVRKALHHHCLREESMPIALPHSGWMEAVLGPKAEGPAYHKDKQFSPKQCPPQQCIRTFLPHGSSHCAHFTNENKEMPKAEPHSCSSHTAEHKTPEGSPSHNPPGLPTPLPHHRGS